MMVIVTDGNYRGESSLGELYTGLLNHHQEHHEIENQLRHELEQARKFEVRIEKQLEKAFTELEQARKWARAWKEVAKLWRIFAFDWSECSAIKWFENYKFWLKESLTDEKG